jgi:hypothetical protein
MPGTILSIHPRQREPLPPLGPGERVINGRVYYSAAWLDAAPSEREAVQIEPADRNDKPKEDIVTYEVRTRFDLEPEPGDDLGPEYIANLVANALRRALTDAALDPTAGVTVHVQPRGAKVHTSEEVAA